MMKERLIHTLCLAGALLFLFPGSSSAQPGLDKCSPLLRLMPRGDVAADYTLVVDDVEAFRQILNERAPEIAMVRLYPPAGIVVVHGRFSVVQEKLLPLKAVLYADIGQADYREELPVPGHNLFVNRVSALHARYPGLNGQGRTISVKEFLFDTLDYDLWGRVAPASAAPGPFSPHASIMATLVAGSGNSGWSGRGVAWGARLSTSGFTGLLPDADSDYEALGVSVQNHSYGLGIENYYGAGALAYDQSVVVRPNLLHVFSAGNFGDSSATTGTYQGLKGFANLSGSFKMAKNVLLVGAVDSFGQVLGFSSRGPAYDGRVKPDLVAFGQDGSSGAAALVSGAAAVLQQAYADKHPGLLPPAALLRAVLLTGADDLGAPGPDYASGFGNLNARRSAEILAEGHYIEASLSQPDTFTYEFDVPVGARALKVTLAWDDLAALAGSAKALVNDLDLRLYESAGQSGWLPYILRVTPDPDSLLAPAYPGLDSLNTVEQIFLSFPAAGRFRIAVHARAVPSGTQAFCVAYHVEKADTFSWVTPTRLSPPVAGETGVLYWEESYPQTTGRLEYRFVDQAAWVALDTSVTLSPGYYRWAVPDTTALMQLRMTIGASTFLSDSFLPSPEMRPKVGFYCPDSTLLYWNSAGHQAQYQLWALGDQYLEPLFVIADTFVVLDRATYPQERLAVSAFIPQAFSGQHSGVRELSGQGVSCYLVNLLAVFDDLQQINISLKVGTSYGLERVILEKKQPGDTYASLESWLSPFDDLVFSTTDAVPQPGPNQYRARLLLTNGKELLSDTVVVNFSGSSGIWVYPNPVSGTGLLRVILQEVLDGTTVELYDGFGRRLLVKAPDSEEFDLLVPSLASGMYLLAVKQNGRRVSWKKVLVD